MIFRTAGLQLVDVGSAVQCIAPKLYASASIVSADRIVFNIKGNGYRLVVSVDFEKAIVWIKWLGTHRDYDRIDVREVEHG